MRVIATNPSPVRHRISGPGFFVLAVVLQLLACGGGVGNTGDALSDDAVADTGSDAVDGTDTSQDEPASDSDVPADLATEDPVTDDTAADTASDDDASDGPELPPARIVTCSDEPPPGADLPDPLPVYDGDCPVLVPGRNTITSGGAAREFILAVPADLDPSEKLPVVFLWHWLGGEAQDFMTEGEIQPAVDEMRFLAISPEAKGDLLMKWPFLLLDSAPRMEEEARFFDDMLACVAGQFDVNESCVSSAGVSAGALWTSQLAHMRSTRLSSFLSLSGGVGAPGDFLNPVHQWSPASHVLPAIVLWGGPTDFCGLTFATTSGYLESALVADGHFFVECVHNCAHAKPPMNPPDGESEFASLWRFVLDHPYWLYDGESQYIETGLPAVFPEWCSIGAGSATIRAGECSTGPLGECW